MSDINLFSMENNAEIHPVALEFARRMTVELKANEHKGDWSDWRDVKEMLYELEWHKAKLMEALHYNKKEQVKEHLADCANILMFIGNAGHLYEDAKAEAIDKGWIKPEGE